jgi:hypothetical protein
MSPKQLAALDRDLAGALPALRRAAAAARRLSIETGTPFYVFKDGQVVDLNATQPKRGGRKRRPR